MKKETMLSNSRSGARKASLAVASVLSVAALGCDQPPPKCNITQTLQLGGAFAGKFTLVDGSKEGEGDCDKLVGEELFFGTYYKPRKDDSPNYRKVSVGLEPATFSNTLMSVSPYMGTEENPDFMPNPDDKQYGYGKFDGSEPDGDDLCHVPDMSAARLRLPEANAFTMQVQDWASDPTGMTLVDVPMPAMPALDITYEFSNVQVYVTPESPGRHAAADLTYTSVADGKTCTARYKVNAVFPFTSCGVPENPDDPASAMKPSDAACDIPAFHNDAVECDPDILVCVPKKDFPSVK